MGLWPGALWHYVFLLLDLFKLGYFGFFTMRLDRRNLSLFADDKISGFIPPAYSSVFTLHLWTPLPFGSASRVITSRLLCYPNG